MNHPVARAVLKRDLKSWFGNPTGYVFIVLFVVLCAAALVTPNAFFQNNLANLDTLTSWFPVLLLLFIPAVTMGMWSSERNHGTQELLFTLPATDGQILLGKYLAAAAIYTASLAFTLVLPACLWYLGSPDLGLLFSTYLGYWLLGLLLISVAMVGSQLTANLTVSFILGAVFCVLVTFSHSVVGFLSTDLGKAWEVYGPGGMFREFGRGIVSFAALIEFTLLTAAFLLVNLLLLSRRHWRNALADSFHGTVRSAAMLVIAVGLGVFALNSLPRIDSTAERVHSLSDATAALLGELGAGRQVTIQAFISDEVPREYVQTRRTLLDLLHRYDALGGEAVQVRIVPTKRFTKAADEARENFGINARPLLAEESGARREFHIYLGVAVVSGTEEVVIPFFEQNMSVEYELTRSIRVAAAVERRKIGILKTDVEFHGGMNMQTFQMRAQWPIVDELELQYEVKNVDPAQPLPDDLDVLVVPMVSSLEQPQMDALAEYVRAGRPTLLIDDPQPFAAPGTSATDPKGGPPQNPMMGRPPPQGQKGQIDGFLRGFGIRYPFTEVVWDASNRPPAFDFLRDRPEIMFLAGQGDAAFAQDQAITRGLQQFVTMFGGHVEPSGNEEFEFIPLIKTSRRSGVLAKSEVITSTPFGGQMLNPRRIHKLDETTKTIACRVLGKNGAEGGENVHLIFLADLDAIGPEFFQMHKQGLGNTGLRFDNVTFILNCIDQLAGDNRFIDLRKKRSTYRTLERIAEEQRVFEEEWLRAKEQAEDDAEKELQAAQDRLDKRIEKIALREDLDQRAKSKMQEEARITEQRVLDVRKAQIEKEREKAKAGAQGVKLRKEDDMRKDNILMALVITPIPALLVGLLVFLRKRRRDAAIVPHERLKRGAA